MKLVIALAILSVVACGDSGATPAETPVATTSSDTVISFPQLGTPIDLPPLPALDAGSVAAGQILYAVHCAHCHGLDLKGDPDWMTPNEDGTYLPPPQDATGHTWHHGDQLLVSIVLDGSDFFESQMPTFRGVLTEDEVLSILDYLKRTWGPEEREVQWAVTVREAADLEG